MQYNLDEVQLTPKAGLLHWEENSIKKKIKTQKEDQMRLSEIIRIKEEEKTFFNQQEMMGLQNALEVINKLSKSKLISLDIIER